ncbi:MAG: ATP-grasp domain-containing protein [Bacteroidales bacterium]
MNRSTDITILTDARYVNPEKKDGYVDNILYEESLVQQAMEKRGLMVQRINWDHPEMDWRSTRYVLFRSTWDYFERFPEFLQWLERVKDQTRMINPYALIRWNMDKHYLGDLQQKGIPIPPTQFIEQGTAHSLADLVEKTGWKEVILKPVVSGAARHTYRFALEEASSHESRFKSLIREEAMMIQEFQDQVLTRGEAAFMLVGGVYTHAVLKKAREGDFRVQDDFGGTVNPYAATPEEIELAERTVALCDPAPLYARVDAIWDREGTPRVSELELIEPELWFRFHPSAADRLAEAIVAHMRTTEPEEIE